MKTSFEDHLKEDRLGLENAMSAAPAKIVASVFKILNSRILVGEMIALDQWELLPIWELPLPVDSFLPTGRISSLLAPRGAWLRQKSCQEISFSRSGGIKEVSFV